MQQGWAPVVYPLPRGAFSPDALTRVPRPGWATAAAIILIASGAFMGLITLITLLIGMVVALAGGTSSSPDPKIAAEGGRAVMAGIAVVGILGSIWTAGHLAAGIGVFKRRGWARVLGIVLSALGAILWVLICVFILATMGMYSDPAFRDELETELGGGSSYGDPAQAALIWSMVLVVFYGSFAVAYLCALFGLVRSVAYFAARPAAARPPGATPPAGAPPTPTAGWPATPSAP